MILVLYYDSVTISIGYITFEWMLCNVFRVIRKIRIIKSVGHIIESFLGYIWLKKEKEKAVSMLGLKFFFF